ncbi:hypothetical protein MRB53_029838 [Persea americana]|uniref:Uncharacterized protein n=1 Tax=Persea americana TaxID=3435 RepID=A0ACC2KJL4_PERAE|nr:hypothetical protein MRB53_029838 [Persea americana]
MLMVDVVMIDTYVPVIKSSFSFSPLLLPHKKKPRSGREKKKRNSRRLLQLLFFDFSFCNLKKKNLLLKSVFIGFLNSFGDRFNRFVDHVG